MKTVILSRIKQSDTGTEGELTTLGFACKTLELPWKDNKPNISCIPVGEYQAVMYNSPKFKRVYCVQNVPGRKDILIHSGNFAGDTEKGFKSDVQGCILLGDLMGLIKNQKAILKSRITLSDFMFHMNEKPFKLIIKR